MHEDHTHIHDHNHEHPHDHDHPHTHAAHTHGEMVEHNEEETKMLLTYMLDHNRSHAEELHEIFHAVEKLGKKECADKIHEAMHHFDHCNQVLAQAVELYGGK